ncbi:M15 family metallopeptidase [Winogradskya humida]|nr:M15 family metallopeptidase [Actinoplanes humidus]
MYARARRCFAVAALAVTVTVAGTPTIASAAVPSSARKWTALMRQSLTGSPEYIALRKTLATQRATLVNQAAGVTTARLAHDGAQTGLTAAVTADGTSRTRLAISVEALTSAKNTRTVVLQQRPRKEAAVTRAQAAVTAAAKTVTADRAVARQSAALLRTALGTALATTGDLDTVTTAWQTTSDRLRVNQQKLVALDTSAATRAQAAAISGTVVNEIRTGFAVTDTTTVYGITVHKSVAFAFKRMLDDAKSDGVTLSGGGFRTRQRQIELRKINGCPDIYTAPPSSCRVPTAIPGRSLHEIGLAVDMTSGGSTLTSGSAGFKWLSAHADEYGYENLPSEPWHWSITGS